jgi:ADP-heptose:LPS heptosyltransferase
VTSSVEKILLIRFKSIGDVLFTLPAVHVVRDNFPDAKIFFLVSKENAPLIEGFRDVNEVIPVDRSVYRNGNPERVIRRTFSLLRELRREKFSLAIDFQGYGETALLTRLSGARQRWGLVYQTMRGLAYTRGVRLDPQMHLADANLSLLRQCGLKIGALRNEFLLPETALRQAREIFAAEKLDENKPTLFIQPFTSTVKKNWPLEKYLTLAAQWRARSVQVIFGGGPSEREALQPARDSGFAVSAGVPLLVNAGLIKLCTLVLGADTGLLHLAAAMKKRVVMIMAFGTSAKTHPFQHPDWTLVPSERIRVAEIEIAEVNRACERAFRELNAPLLSPSQTQ